MVSLTSIYSFWILLIIHGLLLIEFVLFRIFKRFRRPVVDDNPTVDNKNAITSTSFDSTFIPYMNFPSSSLKTFIISLKRNHLFLKGLYRPYTYCEIILDLISQKILLIGILGLSGTIFKAYSGINYIFAGFLASILARCFHFFYSVLQVKQEKIPVELSSPNKLVVLVETEVIRRLNVHRTMRRVLGYFIMVLYYASSMYYSIKFSVTFDNNTNYRWLTAFVIGIGFEVLAIESFKIWAQMEAVNYLKIGGSRSKEAIAKFCASEEFMSTFN